MAGVGLILPVGGQNGRPRGPQMEMSSLVFTIHNFGVPNFDPYPYGNLDKDRMYHCFEVDNEIGIELVCCRNHHCPA